MDTSLTACVWIVAIGAYLLIRNEVVYRIQVAFINDDLLFPAAFRYLPSYDAMVIAPKYQLLWTKGQWIAYVARATGEQS